MTAILRPGETCWRLATAERLAFLVDAAAYFSALRHAIPAARRSVLIVGWDVDSRLRLVPDAEPADGYPAALLPFLNAVLADRPELHVHVLAWDFSMIYAFEREALSSYKFGWTGHRRLHFALDATHPLGASHHQKLVVVDDWLAFVGGVDLTIRRWDTAEHRARDPRRVDPRGVLYGPVHDLQIAVQGEVARELGALARQRWRMATGERIAPVTTSPGEPWPSDLLPDIAPVTLGIARTSARGAEGAPVHEILRLTLEAIRAARRTIFVENQYLTSAAVGEALAERLATPDGPEVVLVLPRVESGWLEQSSMGILRARLLARLREADRHGRLHVLHPVVPDLDGRCVNVHSKLLIVDDRLLKLGSANLSNRLMGLDSECDLALEATGPDADRVARAIAGFRDRLIAEHLGASAELVGQRTAALSRVSAAIDSLRGGARSLEPLVDDGAEEPLVNLAVMGGLVCDPERPIAADELIDELVPDETRTPAQRALTGVVWVMVAVLGAAVLWHLSPLVRWLGLEGLLATETWLRHQPAAPLIVLALFVAGSLVLFPATLLIGVTVLVYSWPRGALYAWAASLVSAGVTYLAGRVLPRRPLQRRWAAQTMWLRGQLRRRGVLSVVIARLVPVGGFSAVNLVAGSLDVPFGAFMIGNALGLVPGIVAMALFVDRVGWALRDPGIINVVLLLLVLAGVVGTLWWLGRRLGRSAPALVSGRR